MLRLIIAESICWSCFLTFYCSISFIFFFVCCLKTDSFTQLTKFAAAVIVLRKEKPLELNNKKQQKFSFSLKGYVDTYFCCIASCRALLSSNNQTKKLFLTSFCHNISSLQNDKTNLSFPLLTQKQLRILRWA